MNRTLLNLVIDLASAVLFLGMVATGYILEFPLPPGTDRSLSLWGFTRHQWGDIHFWISLGFLVVVFLHVCLHWKWLVAVVRRRLGWTTVPEEHLLRSSLALLLVVGAVFGLFAWLTQSAVRKTTDHVPPASAGTAVTAVDFWEEVYPIFERSCVSCHGPRRQLGGFRADRREDYFGAPGRPVFIVPGESARSPLIAIVSGQQENVSPDIHRLSEPEVARLRAWIDAGATWPERPAGK